MPKPQLFLLHPGYGPELNQFCPDCALIEGYFTYQPQLRETVEIVRISFDRPRAQLLTLLGEALQNCPALIFAEGDLPDGVAVSPMGRAYINDGRAISRWLGEHHNGMIPS